MIQTLEPDPRMESDFALIGSGSRTADTRLGFGQIQQCLTLGSSHEECFIGLCRLL